MTENESGLLPAWCILELLGHRRLAGYLSEQQIAGVAFLRLDVPGVGTVVDAASPDIWAASQFYSPSSVYCLTPCSEEAARLVAGLNRPQPVTQWELSVGGRDEEPEYADFDG